MFSRTTDEVDVRREEEGTEVHVQVEVEAKLEEQATLEDSGRHVGSADGTEEDRVELAQLVDRLVGEHLAGPQVAGAAEVVLLRVEGNARGTRATLMASATTSGPMPSPPITAMLCDLVVMRWCCSRKSENRPRRDGRKRTPGKGVRYEMMISASEWIECNTKCIRPPYHG